MHSRVAIRIAHHNMAKEGVQQLQTTFQRPPRDTAQWLAPSVHFPCFRAYPR